MPTGPCGRLYSRQGVVDICGLEAGHHDNVLFAEHEGRHTGVKWKGGNAGTRNADQEITNLGTVGLAESA